MKKVLLVLFNFAFVIQAADIEKKQKLDFNILSTIGEIFFFKNTCKNNVEIGKAVLNELKYTPDDFHLKIGFDSLNSNSSYTNEANKEEDTQEKHGMADSEILT